MRVCEARLCPRARKSYTAVGVHRAGCRLPATQGPRQTGAWEQPPDVQRSCLWYRGAKGTSRGAARREAGEQSQRGAAGGRRGEGGWGSVGNNVASEAINSQLVGSRPHPTETGPEPLTRGAEHFRGSRRGTRAGDSPFPSFGWRATWRSPNQPNSPPVWAPRCLSWGHSEKQKAFPSLLCFFHP